VKLSGVSGAANVSELEPILKCDAGPMPLGESTLPGMSRRVSWVLASVVLAAVELVGGLLRISSEGDGWVTVGAFEQLRRQGVTYLGEEHLFLVVNGSPLALSAVTLPGRTDFAGRVLYCGSDGWFYSHHRIFDHLGYYRYGPASRGLDRVAVRVSHGHVQVDPDEVAPGPSFSDGSVASAGTVL
jgi:hypothetical protein